MAKTLIDVAKITSVQSLSPNVRPGFTQIDFSGRGFGFVVVADQKAAGVKSGDLIGVTEDKDFVFPLVRK